MSYPGMLCDELRGAVKNLVMVLRHTADDLDQAEPTDAKELDGKLRGLIDTVLEGTLAIAAAADAYDQVPEEPVR